MLQDVNIKIEDGDFLVLLGGSGCGKSTLLNCVAGLDDASAGRILIKGRDVTMLDPSARNVAMVFQSYALYPTMTVERNISFGLECAGVSKAERSKHVERVAALLRISDLLKRRPFQLSGGQRQRVAIGRALVRNPDIFLLDEPMSNLDAKLRNQMREELRELHKTLGATFVLVTHDQIEAMSMATKIAVLDRGRVQQFGTPYEVYHRPENMFVAAFVGATKMNFLEGKFALVDAVPHIQIGSSRISLAGYVYADQPPKEGDTVVLGVRPENIYRSLERVEGNHYLEVDLKVERTELTGGDVLASFEFERQALLCRFRSSRTPDVGAVQKLYVDMQNCSLFDKRTERRL
nr:ABC transporter ATP-binding protein [Ensifer sp. Root142]